MFYWSRWANISMIVAEREDEMNTGYRQAVKREARPVVVIARSNSQILSAITSHQQNKFRARETSPRISLDVRRQTYARPFSTDEFSSAGEAPDATTQTVLIE